MPLVGGRRYFTSTAVFLNEVLKLAICVSVALFEIAQHMALSAPATSLFTTLFAAVFTGDSWKLAIPATLYTLQNSLQYLAVSHLEAATLQVTYQFKILPTAIFSVLILRRSIAARQWAALGLLMVGVVIVQLPAAQSSSGHSHWHLPRGLTWLRNEVNTVRNVHKRSATYEGIEEDFLLEHPPRNELIGLLEALGACTVSALGSVYFEKIVKDSTNNVGIWVRNVQLSVYSLFPAFFIGVLFVDGEDISKYGFFTGYNWVVWNVITCQALGGIIVALCVYYADTVTKSFATSISILLSLCISMFFFEFILTINVRILLKLSVGIGDKLPFLGDALLTREQFIVGTSIVLYATYLYNSEDQRNRPPVIKLSENEKTLIDRSFAIKLPSTPLKETALSTSTPNSPALHHMRTGSSREYFGKKE